MNNFPYSQQYFLGKLKKIKKTISNSNYNEEIIKENRQNFIILRKELQYFIANNDSIDKSKYLAIDTDAVKFCDTHKIAIRGFFEQIAYFLKSLFFNTNKSTPDYTNICTEQLKPKNFPKFSRKQVNIDPLTSEKNDNTITKPDGELPCNITNFYL